MKSVALIFFAVAFVGVGTLHFVRAESFMSIVPPYLPAHRELVYVSGALEILGGLALLIPRLRRYAGWGLIALLLAVFPANVHMAMNPHDFDHLGMPTWALYARLPLQFLLMLALWWITKPERKPS